MTVYMGSDFNRFFLFSFAEHSERGSEARPTRACRKDVHFFWRVLVICRQGRRDICPAPKAHQRVSSKTSTLNPK